MSDFNRFESLVQAIDGIVWEADRASLNFTFVSQACFKILGYSSEQWLANPNFWSEHVYHQDRDFATSFCLQESTAGRNHQLEYRMVTATGEIIWIHDQVTVDGEFLRGLMVDVTRLREVDRQHAQTEVSLHALFNSSTDFTYLVDAQFRVELFNEAAARSIQHYFNRTIKKGDLLEEFAPEHNKSLLRERLQRAMIGERIEAEVHIQLPSGQDVWLLARYNPVYQAGLVLAVAVSFSDITSRKSTELVLRERETQLRSLADSLPNGAIYQRVMNADGTQRSAYFSKGFSQIIGIEQSEIVESNDYLNRVVLPEDLPRFRKAETMAISTKGIFDVEFRIKHAVSGSVKWLQAIARCRLLDDGGMIWDGYVFDVTKRKSGELELATSQANLSSIFENSDTGFVLFDRQFTVVQFNRLANAVCRQYLGREMKPGVDGLAFFDDQPRAKLRQHFETALNGENASFEIDYGTPDNPFWLFGRVFGARDDSGKVHGVVLAFTDITLLKQASEKEMRSNRLFESLVKSHSSFLIRTDMQGRYTFANDAFLRHFGFELNEIIGVNSLETIHVEDLAACQKAVFECIANPGRVVSLQFRKPNKAGDFFWTEWEFVTIQNVAGEVTEMQCIGYDITGRLASEKKLEDTALRLSLANKSAGIGVWERDLANDLIIWDDRMFEIFGVPKNHTLNVKSYLGWICPDDIPLILERFQSVIENREPVNFRYRIIRQTDKSIRWLHTYAIVYPDVHQRVNKIVGVNFDVTEQIEREHQIMEAKAEINELQLRAFQLAMNPHFVFNALNSIQYFVVEEKKDLALNYLSKFAKLLRGLVDSTNLKLAPLSQELKLIEYYVEIERLRFKGQFIFDLQVREGIDVDLIQLPPFLLQPFVENAIVHGLHTKNGRGYLQLHISKNEQQLSIKIEDNGIGRAAANDLRNKNFPAHASRGYDIIQKRITLLSSQKQITFQTEDLFEDNAPSGTRVTIRVDL